jgi:hypothetical protein
MRGFLGFLWSRGQSYGQSDPQHARDRGVLGGVSYVWFTQWPRAIPARKATQTHQGIRRSRDSDGFGDAVGLASGVSMAGLRLRTFILYHKW